MTFSGLPTLKSGTVWVVVVATSAANPAVVSESSEREALCLFCFGKAEKKLGEGRGCCGF